MKFLNDKEPISKDKMDKISKLSHEQLLLEEKIMNATNETDIINYIDHNFSSISIATLENIVNLYKRRLEKIKREQLPAIMNELNISEIVLRTGEKITVKDKVKPSLSKENILIAMKKMIEQEKDLIIRDFIKTATEKNIPITEDMYEDANEIAKKNIESLFKNYLKIEYTDIMVRTLLKLEKPFEQDISIHNKTLEKYCREKLEAGEKIPDEIKVFQYQETKLN